MQKRVLFLATHLCSGSEPLFQSLANHPRIQGYITNSIYEGPLDLQKLTSLPHKLTNSSAVYMDELVFNHAISSKTLYALCNYVIMIREPRVTLNEIVAFNNYTEKAAANYYCFRLRRLCSIAAASRKAVLITENDLSQGKGLDLIESHLRLKEPLKFIAPERPVVDDVIRNGLVVECEEAYEKSLYFMRQACLSTAGGSLSRSLN